MTKRSFGRPKSSAEEVYESLRRKFPAPAYACFREVRNTTGYSSKVRSADALIFSLWPGRGLDVTGYEIKVARSDFLAEMKNPEKADEIQRFCDYWYVAIHDDHVAKKAELPENWGLILCRGDAVILKPAKKLEPEPMTRSFLASVMRSAHNQIEKVRKEGHQEGYALGTKEAPDEHDRRIKMLEMNNERLTTMFKTFKEKTGIEMSEWDAGYVGDAVKKLMEGRFRYDIDPTQRLINLRDQVKRMGEQLDDQVKYQESLDKTIAEGIETMLKGPKT